ncbi:Piso0_005346 [Millerozyma farinosa CBS 7064]|uniref:Piso0_005346 protein n=1 Tax=Pichia sorbitophila (strain ATCC MYA-4447 / BCRC 22081 / CBS 7064 / NBRC 10061 / NRRL Y-12695) TaxID=559304 RepID=G8Y4V6_PICSO|nr:Piso0_005346 [Millerozyma farinosa CBS 7064]
MSAEDRVSLSTHPFLFARMGLIKSYRAEQPIVRQQQVTGGRVTSNESNTSAKKPVRARDGHTKPDLSHVTVPNSHASSSRCVQQSFQSESIILCWCVPLNITQNHRGTGYSTPGEKILTFRQPASKKQEKFSVPLQVVRTKKQRTTGLW